MGTGEVVIDPVLSVCRKLPDYADSSEFKSSYDGDNAMCVFRYDTSRV